MHSVVFLLEHGAEGTLGFIVNRPVDVRLADLWAECPGELSDVRIACEGGPVERNKGLLLHACPDLPGAQPMGLGLAVGGDMAALVECFRKGPDRRGPRLFLGHSGWGPRQLAGELERGTWIVQPATPDLLLGNRPPEKLWQELIGDVPGLPQPSLN